MIDWMAPEILLGGGAALGASALFVYYFLFKGKKPKASASPTETLRQAEQQFEALKKIVENKTAEKKEIEQPKIKSLHEALSQTRQSFWGRIAQNFTGDKLNKSQLESIEEVLYTSDLGPKTVQRLFNTLEEKNNLDGDGLKTALRAEMMSIFSSVDKSTSFSVRPEGLTTWMVVGVNGAGKTTTIGKLASQLQQQGKKVMIAAGDTFRAAADEQLKVWSERAQVEIFSPENVKDPSAVAFDAVNKAQAKGFDVVIVDTAGRLHTQKNLMEELKKIKRVMQKVVPTAPDETILVLDANSGQNALIQAQQFHEALQVTGVILTKMDGSAKGGVAMGIACDVGLPVKMIGVGEAVEDLRPFSANDFVDSIL